MHPELRVLLSVCLMMLGDYDEAVTAVTVDPHPTLQAQLGNHFLALERELERRGDPRGAARCRMEHEFLAALATLGKPEPAALEATSVHVREFLAAASAAGRSGSELRGYALYAAHFVALGETPEAEKLGERAQKLGLALPDWQRALFGDRLRPLLEFEVWSEVLRRPGG